MRKIVFRVVIGVLVFLVLFPWLLSLCSIEFSRMKYEEVFETIQFFGIPLCILLTLVGTYNSNDPIGWCIFKVLMSMFLALVAFAVIAASSLSYSKMCIWIDVETVFIHREKSGVSIVKRELGCGIFDSGPQNIKYCRTKELSKYFKRSVDIELDALDQSEWISVADKD